MPRLYVCTVTIEYVALAESVDEARDFARDVVNDVSYYDNYTDAHAMTASTPIPADWFGETLVYHKGDEDISLDEALERYPRTVAKSVTLPVTPQPDVDHSCFMPVLDSKKLLYPCSGDGWYLCSECCCFHPTKADK